MDDLILEKYVNLTATPEEIEAVREYLLEDMERCFLILQKMRERAMKDLNLTSDPIIDKILSENNNGIYAWNVMLRKDSSILRKDLRQEVDMRKVLNSLF